MEETTSKEFETSSGGHGASYALIGAALAFPSGLLCAAMGEDTAIVAIPVGAVVGFACSIFAVRGAMKSSEDGLIAIGFKAGAAMLLIANSIAVLGIVLFALVLLGALANSRPLYLFGAD